MKLDKISLLILTTALIAIKTINLPRTARREFTSESNLKITQIELSSDPYQSNFTSY